MFSLTTWHNRIPQIALLLWRSDHIKIPFCSCLIRFSSNIVFLCHHNFLFLPPIRFSPYGVFFLRLIILPVSVSLPVSHLSSFFVCQPLPLFDPLASFDDNGRMHLSRSFRLPLFCTATSHYIHSIEHIMSSAVAESAEKFCSIFVCTWARRNLTFGKMQFSVWNLIHWLYRRTTTTAQPGNTRKKEQYNVEYGESEEWCWKNRETKYP